MIFTSLLYSLFLHHYDNIFTHYYIFYYFVLLRNLLLIITSLLHCYYTIIISLLQMGNRVIMTRIRSDYIITWYAKSNPLLSHYYYELLRHYYTEFYYYPLLSISVSWTCRCSCQQRLQMSESHGQLPTSDWGKRSVVAGVQTWTAARESLAQLNHRPTAPSPCDAAPEASARHLWQYCWPAADYQLTISA